MSTWKKIKISTLNNEFVEAVAPEIISASRSTDIPAFYSDWFIERLKIGYSVWKNPTPIIKHLDFIKSQSIECYFQYTLNDYENENLESNLPKLTTRIETFKSLVDQLGVGNVIWRFDPLILSNELTIDVLIERITFIGDKLKGHTKKLVFSFVDITEYGKVSKNIKALNNSYREFTNNEKISFVSQLIHINKTNNWNYELATCCEDIELEKYGIQHNKCIDDEFIAKQFSNNTKLINFLGVDPNALILYGDFVFNKKIKR